MTFDWKRGWAIGAAMSLFTVSVLSGLPQPMCVFYGQAKDDYGWPYLSGADVVLRVGTNEYARHSINGSLTPGVNFALYVHLDDGSDAEPYAHYAMNAGDGFEIVVVDGDGEKTIMETNGLPHVGRPGEIIYINVTAGTDSDQDGLPDEWEQYIVDASTNPAISSINDVHGSDDYDGDGSPNDEEYYAGTFAFLDYDYFFAEHMTPVGNGRMMVDFLSVPGKVYAVECATNVATGPWADCEYSETESGELTIGPTEGDGDWLEFFIPVTETNYAFRLTVR